jgi:hypothetical protein
LLKGLETLQIRLEAQSSRALQLALWLENHPRVRRVYYPGLPSHPQFDLARRQQKSGGAIVSFVVDGARAEAWKVVDSCRLLSITANLGDTKTTLTHPASTTHGAHHPGAARGGRHRRGLAADRGRTRSRGGSAERPRLRFVVDLAAAGGFPALGSGQVFALAGGFPERLLGDARHHEVSHQARANADQPEEKEAVE